MDHRKAGSSGRGPAGAAGAVNCTLEEDVMLRDCTLPALYMPGTHLPKLDAQRLQCNGPLHLRAGFQATGLVDLTGARLTGSWPAPAASFWQRVWR